MEKENENAENIYSQIQQLEKEGKKVDVLKKRSEEIIFKNCEKKEAQIICASCGQPIEVDDPDTLYYSVNGKSYHEDCFPPCPNGSCRQ